MPDLVNIRAFYLIVPDTMKSLVHSFNAMQALVLLIDVLTLLLSHI